MKKAGSARLFLFVKAIITVSLIAAICTKVDISMLSRHLDGGGALYFLLGLSLLALNDVIVATRWWLLLRRLNVETMSLGYAIAATYSSVFVGQVLPGTVGSDAVRGWFCYGRGTSLRVTVISLLTDRLLALVGVREWPGFGNSRHLLARSAPIGWSKWNVSLELGVAPAGAWPAELIDVTRPAMRRMPGRTPLVLAACSRAIHAA